MPLILSKEAAESNRKGRLLITARAMERLNSAMHEEGVELATKDISALCELALNFHLKAPTWAAIRRDSARSLRKLKESVANDSRRVSHAMARVETALNKCSDQTRFEICKRLQAKGIAPKECERVMNGFTDVLQELHGDPSPPTKPGNTRGMDADYWLACWAVLGRGDVGLRAASRVIARLLYSPSDTAKSEVIYQTIRNFEIGKE